MPPQAEVLRGIGARRHSACHIHLLEHASEDFVQLEQDLSAHLDYLLREGQHLVGLANLELRNVEDKWQGYAVLL